MNIDELVDNILLTRDPAFKINNEIRDVELENFISNIFEDYQKFDKDIIQKIYNIATHPKFKYWLDTTYDNSDKYRFIWHPISNKNCSLIEIEKHSIVNAVPFAQDYYTFYDSQKFLKHTTPLEWLAFKMTVNEYNRRRSYNDLFITRLSEICYRSYNSGQDAEFNTRFKKVLFAALDMSLTKNFKPTDYQMIRW